MFSQLAINIIFGFIVGAGTNAFAIYCIFRWILPNKKAEMAASVREVISGELFSTGKIVERLNDPAIGGQITENISNWLDQFMERELPCLDELMKDNSADLDKLSRSLRLILMTEILNRLAQPEFREKVLKPFLYQRWDDIRFKNIFELFPQLQSELPLIVLPVAEKLLKSASFRARASMTLSETLMVFLESKDSINDLLSPEMRRAFLKLASDQSHFVIEHLADALEQPEFQDVISTTICSTVHDQLSTQGGFLNRVKQFGSYLLGIDNDIKKMCTRLPNTIRAQFLKPNSQEQVRQALLRGAGEFLKKDWREAFNHPTQRQIQGLIYLGLTNAWSNPDTVNRITAALPGIIEKMLRRPIGEISGIEQEGKTFEQILEAVQEMSTGSEMRRIINGRAEEMIMVARKMPLGRPARFISAGTRDNLAQIGAEEARALIAGRLHEFTEQTGLWNIVSDSVEAYDNKELERMIRRIASRELTWVTWLGGIIGALLGIIQTITTILIR